jgi:L-lactate dehydrogenase
MSFYPRPARVVECDDRYEELACCDVIVNAAGHVDAARTDRDGELVPTTEEPKKFVRRIEDAGFAGIWVSVSNPNDVIATEIRDLADCDPHRVLGSGTTLDSARFKHALAGTTGLSQASINAWMLGEHGFSEFALWSHVTFGCLTPEELEAQTGVTLDRDELEMQAVRGGYTTMVGKACTEYSIANGTVAIIEAVLGDTKLVTPVSTLVEGVYGVSGHYASLPCVIGANGVEKAIVPTMTPHEQERWQASCRHIEENIAKVSW